MSYSIHWCVCLCKLLWPHSYQIFIWVAPQIYHTPFNPLLQIFHGSENSLAEMCKLVFWEALSCWFWSQLLFKFQEAGEPHLKYSHIIQEPRPHLRCSSKLKVHLPFLLPLQASTTARHMAWHIDLILYCWGCSGLSTKRKLNFLWDLVFFVEPGCFRQVLEWCRRQAYFLLPEEWRMRFAPGFIQY